MQEAFAQADVHNQAQSTAQPQGDPSELLPRLCHLVRSETGYGFNLHSDRSRPGQYIRSLDPGSPADLAGLRPQDRLVEVGRRGLNGAFVLTWLHYFRQCSANYSPIFCRLQSLFTMIVKLAFLYILCVCEGCKGQVHNLYFIKLIITGYLFLLFPVPEFRNHLEVNIRYSW